MPRFFGLSLDSDADARFMVIAHSSHPDPERRWHMNRFNRLMERLLSGGGLTKWN